MDLSVPATPEARSGAPARHRLRQPRHGREWRRRLATYALFGFSFVLMVNALVGENGYLATLRARQEYNSLMSDVNRMRLENQQLREDIRRLRDDPAALEEAARRDLRLMKPGETLIIIRDHRPASAPPAGR